MSLGLEGALGANEFQKALRQQILDQEAQKQQAFQNSITSRTADRADAQQRILQQEHDAALAERTQLAAVSNATKLAPDLPINQNVSPQAAGVLRMGGMGGQLYTPPTMAETESGKPFDSSNAMPSVNLGTPAQQKDEGQRVLRGRLLADPSLTPQQKLEMQSESAGLRAPTREPKPTAIGDANYMLNGKPIIGLKNSEGRINYQGQDVTDKVQPYVPPRDTSGSDANRLDKSYQFNSSQLEKVRTPIASKADRLAGLNEQLTQGTPSADALVAPEILSIAAGGQGSGLRMNEAEISRIVGGRSAWENLKASLQHLSTDPKSANSITPDQRAQMRQILTAAQSRVQSKVSAINKAEQALVDAEDVRGHRQVLTDLQGQLDAIDTGGGTPTAPTPRQIRYGMDGKPLP